jgi:hypothetical protein
MEKARQEALKLMKDAGFQISSNIRVMVDPELPFMGYSTKRNGADVIVVSGAASKSAMVQGLLIHEMCHIYRMNTNHPSHNHEILYGVFQHVLHSSDLTEDYQINVIQQAINHVQDLYADDIAFQVFGRSNIFPLDQAFGFFLDWINDEPTASKDDKAVWSNISTMLNNCFALSNMIRHGVPDINGEAATRIERFLSRVGGKMKDEFAYFRDFMTGLKENVTEKEFEQSLLSHLMKVAELAR